MLQTMRGFGLFEAVTSGITWGRVTFPCATDTKAYTVQAAQAELARAFSATNGGCLGNREPPKDRRFFLICLEKVPAYEQSFIRSRTAPQPSAYFTAPLPSDNSIAAAGQGSIHSHRTPGPIERRACRRCPGERVGRPAQPQDAGPTAQRNREEPWAAGDAPGRAHGAENQHDASTSCIRLSPTGRLPLTLEAFITAYGLSLPTDHFSLVALADAVLDRARDHPLGNFGGGLSWPLELSVQAQRTVLASARDYAMRHPNPPRMGPSLGILEYLNSNQPLSAQAIDDPANALETLLSTPRAQAMGQALQTQLNGIATATSASDYVLAAINLVLDPQSLHAPAWTKVADFDLTQTEHWGKPTSAIRDGLSAHLVKQGDATPAMATVAAHLLLARKAPELLIKDLPESVTYGSPAWVSLSVAAATIEAQTPGKVPNMTFAQVMMEAESAGLQDLTVTQQAQSDALRVWGLVSGTLSAQEADRYGPADKQEVRSAFNAQANERLEASVQIDTEIPSRRAIALAKLKERFGEDVPFEEKLLTVKATTQPHDEPLYNPNRAPAGRHSLLDIAMSGLHAYQWESQDPRVIEATRGKSMAFDVNSVFNEQFAHAVDLRKRALPQRSSS